jgi:type II secretory pathway pseudopilin PulG
MRASPRPERRAAFTLLEMLLAGTIAALLMAALYVALEIQLRHAEAARDVVEQTVLARSLLNRMAGDIAPSLGTPDPARYQTTSTAPSTTAPATGTPGGSTTPPADGTGGTTGGTTTPGTTPPAPTTSATSPRVVAVVGDATRVTLSISRLPRPSAATTTLDGPFGASDLRTVTYWLAGGTDAPLGLARTELAQVTSEDAAAEPPEITDPTSRLIIAPEVKFLLIEYFDGSAWVESWDASQPGPDGVMPVGPPMAVAITIGLLPRSAAVEGVEPRLKYYRHVVAIPTANGASAVQSQEEPATGGTTP